MKKIITIIAVISISFGFGQTAIKKSSLSTGGGSHTVGNTTLTYAVGEVAVQENSVGTVQLSEGFIGPDLMALGVEDYGQLQGVNIYPNPVQTDLNIILPESNNYELYLYDLNGKQLINTTVENDNQVVLDLSLQKTGMYLLLIIDRKNKTTTTIKVQKQ
jgi:hypothetical protein